tara:strand:- start:119 stop:1285 length:1167 start_codon:yes stop_codon:yes gene_type:complete
MAFVAIPNNPNWEYDDAATAADTYSDANGTVAAGIRTFTPPGGTAQLTYIKVRKVGDTGDINRGELSKGFWDAKGDEDDVAPFQMTVRTTTSNESMTIPVSNLTIDATIDWGDGSTTTATSYTDSGLIHTYASAGDHSISITGTFPSIKFNAGNGVFSGHTGADCTKVIAVTNLGKVGWQDLRYSFSGCSNMTSFTSGVCDTSSLDSLTYMLRNCDNLTSVDLSTMDTSNVTRADLMFYSCYSLTSIDLSSWDTSSFRFLNELFRNCYNCASIDVSGWDTSSVLSMNGLFEFTGRDAATFDVIGVENLDISALNTYYSSLSDFVVAPVALPTARYDALLINWEAQNVGFTNAKAFFGSSQYTAGGAAETARTSLITNDNWTFYDGGSA